MNGRRRRSHLLVGEVGHRRLRLHDYAFTHDVWYLAVDLDELAELDAGSRLLSYDRGGLLQLRTRDHFPRLADGLAAGVRAHLEEGGFNGEDWRITLVAYPRVLGYVFNPVSFYLCHDVDGRLTHVIAEVHNTHGEREVYDFAPDEAAPCAASSTSRGQVFTSAARKRFYVSPFVGPEAHYRLRVVEAGDQLAIALHETEGVEGAEGAPTLDATLRLRRLPMTDANLARLMARDPLMGVKTIAFIVWHAARLWWAGVPWERFRPRAEYQRRR